MSNFLKKYSEDIYKCSKCGLCQAACPVFKATGTEGAVSRGKFTLLNAVVQNKLPFSKKISGYLDLCLACKACEDYCPAGIKVEEIIISGREYSNSLYGKGFIKKIILSCFNSNVYLSLLALIINIYRILRLNIISGFLFSGLKPVNKELFVFNNMVKQEIQYRNLKPVGKEKDIKLVYFPGCVNSYINPDVKNSVLMVLEANGYNVEIPEGLSCCGIPAKSSGDIQSFIRHAKNNLDRIPSNIDYLLTDCASCGAVWELYKQLPDESLSQKAKILAEKSININKFLSQSELFIPESTGLKQKITYHEPCHLRHKNSEQDCISLLTKISGIEYIEMEDYNSCCGAAGSFCIYNPEISKKISKEKAVNIINSGADTVITSCPSCKIGLLQGLAGFDKHIKVLQPVEILSKLYISIENK